MCIHPRRSNACVIYLILSKVYFFPIRIRIETMFERKYFFFLRKSDTVLFSILFLSRALNADRDPHLADKTTKDGNHRSGIDDKVRKRRVEEIIGLLSFDRTCRFALPWTRQVFPTILLLSLPPPAPSQFRLGNNEKEPVVNRFRFLDSFSWNFSRAVCSTMVILAGNELCF